LQGITVIKENNWMDARKGVEISYRIEQQGVFGYIFSCGDILVNVMDEEFRDEIYKTIREMDNGQGGKVGCNRNPPVLFEIDAEL
jgi:hypothetical protein